ncbi:MAG: hypothetical protein M1836_002622 [Candelina mexicana]|nr:MAG: hypothetical protein M1836_002622 [Candelina mexicana]
MAATLRVVSQNESWEANDEGIPTEFMHTKVILESLEDGDFFYATIKARYRSVAEIDATQLEPHPIQAAHIYPPYSASLTRAPDPLPAGCYVKRPSLLEYGDPGLGETDLSDLLLNEAEICEALMQSPHPNIAHYLGCQVRDGRIRGLCFASYDTTLSDQLDDYTRPLIKCLDGIKCGIQHIHSLGLIHNDINPSNVMMNADGVPVIIDFDSCKAEGLRLDKGGTLGWDHEGLTSLRENDYYGLDKIAEALEEHDRLVEAARGMDESKVPDSLPHTGVRV